MRVLITGSTGFTGQHFLQMQDYLGITVVPLKSNLLRFEDLVSEMSNLCFDTVIHLAAISSIQHFSAEELYAVNVVGTDNLLRALCEIPNKPAKVLVSSSAQVYGATGLEAIHEDIQPNPSNHYAISKTACEFLIRQYNEEFPIVIARPFNYTGLGQRGDFVIPKIIKHFKELSPSISLGNTDSKREFNDVRMICESYVNLLNYAPSASIFNICTSKTYSINDVIDILKTITGHKIEIIKSPEFLRLNDISRLCGSNLAYQALDKSTESDFFKKEYRLEETLRWMLKGNLI